MPDHDRAHFPALTGIRAVAAYMVFAHHFNPMAGPVGHLIREFHVGVNIFFVLSGFLICYRYKQNNRQAPWRLSYFQNRLARIYPLFFLITTITFLFPHNGLPFDWHGYLMNISLLKGFSGSLSFSGIPQSWSLTVEECFYISAPLILLIKRKWYLFCIPILLTGAGVLLVYFFRDSTLRFFGSLQFMFVYTFFGRCTEFMVGVFLAYLFRERPRPVPGYKRTLFGVAGILACIIAMSFLSDELHSSLDNPAGMAINHVVLPVFVAVFLLGLLKEETVAQRLLSTSPMRLLGRSSYAFYLIHVGVFQVALLKWVTGNLLAQFVIFNILAIGLYLFIEHPINNLLRSRQVVTG